MLRMLLHWVISALAVWVTSRVVKGICSLPRKYRSLTSFGMTKCEKSRVGREISHFTTGC